MTPASVGIQLRQIGRGRLVLGDVDDLHVDAFFGKDEAHPVTIQGYFGRIQGHGRTAANGYCHLVLLDQGCPHARRVAITAALNGRPASILP
jgi:hypothetical protein